ncbi:hypothetical protein D3C86_1822280 [compost metagenome]
MKRAGKVRRQGNQDTGLIFSRRLQFAKLSRPNQHEPGIVVVVIGYFFYKDIKAMPLSAKNSSNSKPALIRIVLNDLYRL